MENWQDPCALNLTKVVPACTQGRLFIRARCTRISLNCFVFPSSHRRRDTLVTFAEIPERFRPTIRRTSDAADHEDRATRGEDDVDEEGRLTGPFLKSRGFSYRVN